jgi:hypothetical protein
VPTLGFVRAIIRLHARFFTLAVVALLLGGTGGGRYASTDRVCQHSPPTPFLVGISGVLKNEPSAAAPRDLAIPHGLGWAAARTECEGYAPDRGSPPPPNAPPVRRRGCTALMFAAARDYLEIVDKLLVARADLNTKDSIYGCALPPSARPAALLVRRL